MQMHVRTATTPGENAIQSELDDIQLEVVQLLARRFRGLQSPTDENNIGSKMHDAVIGAPTTLMPQTTLRYELDQKMTEIDDRLDDIW